MRTIVLALLVAATLAGCLNTGEVEPGERSTEGLTLTDAAAAFNERAESANMALLGEYLESGGQEVDAWGDFLAVDRGTLVQILRLDGQGGFELVGELTNAGGVEDIKWSKDGEYLFVGSDAEGSIAPIAGNGPLTGGYYVYDTSDKSNPTFLFYEPVGPRRGPHMLTVFDYGDREILFGASAEITIHEFDRDAQTLTEIARYTPNLVTAYNRDPTVFDVLYQGMAHDMFPFQLPSGEVYLYVSNWDAGLVIVDVTDPANPVELGLWNDFPEGHEGNLHTASTMVIDDRVITVGSVEVGFLVVGGTQYLQGMDRSILYVWDTTDPANIQLLGTWENPRGEFAGRDMVPGEEISSTHNLQFEDGYVYMAHYALGVFVIQADDEEAWANPKTLGFYDVEGMNVWDVVLVDGVIYSSGQQGVKALHYLPDFLGPEGITSRA